MKRICLFDLSQDSKGYHVRVNGVEVLTATDRNQAESYCQYLTDLVTYRVAALAAR